MFMLFQLTKRTQISRRYASRRMTLGYRSQGRDIQYTADGIVWDGLAESDS